MAKRVAGLKLYTSYSFKDHDPIMDRVDTMIKDEGVSFSEVSQLSGVSAGTLSNWYRRKTKRPQFATIMAVTRSLGYDLQMVKSSRKVSPSANVKFTRNVAAKAEAGLTQH